jgi:hypothetical protein
VKKALSVNFRMIRMKRKSTSKMLKIKLKSVTVYTSSSTEKDLLASVWPAISGPAPCNPSTFYQKQIMQVQVILQLFTEF